MINIYCFNLLLTSVFRTRLWTVVNDKKLPRCVTRKTEDSKEPGVIMAWHAKNYCDTYLTKLNRKLGQPFLMLHKLLYKLELMTTCLMIWKLCIYIIYYISYFHYKIAPPLIFFLKKEWLFNLNLNFWNFQVLRFLKIKIIIWCFIWQNYNYIGWQDLLIAVNKWF